ncbi:acid protease [Cubamyces sp. BRFM 1775]|nr:acid protease [Cubamyces sp. BRFM 1775]
MKASTPLSLSLLLAASYNLVDAARLSVHARPRHRRVGGGSGIGRRASVVGNTSVGDAGDIEYTTDITLGGKKFTVQIDTGSSDLWVAGTVPNTKSTGHVTKVQYAVDSVEGNILTSALEFAGYTVDDQAFISVPVSSQDPDGQGLIGLGPNTGSQVRTSLGSPSGDAVLDRIFQQNTTTPNYITILLGRIRDPTDPPTGDLTVGELLPGYEKVTSQPKLPVSVVARDNAGNQHWQILLDADGIIGPAGDNVIEEMNIETVVGSTSNDKQLTVVLDTGYSLPQVPSRVAEAFYKNVPGASLVNRPDLNGDIWELPCDKEVNITFKFGGDSFHIHPLDTNLDLNLTNSQGQHVCVGAFQPMNAQDGTTYDMIFGMAFCKRSYLRVLAPPTIADTASCLSSPTLPHPLTVRNAYTYINFGDFVDGSTSSTADPYVQLLPTTNDTAEAHADFVRVRGNSPWTPSGATLGERLHARLPLIIGLSAAAGVVLLLAFAACCYFSRRDKRRRVAFFRSATYQQLHEPAPPEAHDLHLVNNHGGQQPPAYQPGYSNPWDARY